MNNELQQRLIAEALAKATSIRTITRVDGTTVSGPYNSGTATEGDFQVYVLLVERRASARAIHYRATYYLRQGERFVRVSEAAWKAALAETGA